MSTIKEQTSYGTACEKKIFLRWQSDGTVIPYLTGLNIYSQQAKCCLGCIPKIIHYLHLDKIQHTDMCQGFAVRKVWGLAVITGVFFSFLLFFLSSFFFPLTLSLLQYHSFQLSGYHLWTLRESPREEQGPETRTQVKRGKQELLAIIKACSSLKSTRANRVRGIPCPN